MVKGWLAIFFVVMLGVASWAQVRSLDSVLLSNAENRLISGIYDMNQRTAVIAYNVANASTPGFQPIRYADEVEEAVRLYGSANSLNEVSVEDEMVKATNARLKQTAYVRLLSTKMSITKRIVTLGKGG